MSLARRAICSCLRLVNHTPRLVFSHSTHACKAMKRSASGSGVMLRHLRYREKVSGQLDPPGCIELVVIGSGVHGTPKSFVISTDHIRWVMHNVSCTQVSSTLIVGRWQSAVVSESLVWIWHTRLFFYIMINSDLTPVPVNSGECIKCESENVRMYKLLKK